MLGFDCLMLGLLVILRGTHKPTTLWLVGYTQLARRLKPQMKVRKTATSVQAGPTLQPS